MPGMQPGTNPLELLQLQQLQQFEQMQRAQQKWCKANIFINLQYSKKMKLALLVLLITLARPQAINTEMYLEVSNKEVLDNDEHGVIYNQNKLNHFYNDTIFVTELNCRNDNLEVVNNSQGSQLLIHYENIPNLTLNNAQIAVYPN